MSAAGPAIAGGVLYFLGYLGYGAWPCLLVFLVPLWRALDRTPSVAAALVVGFVFGCTAYAGGFLWMWPLVDTFLDGNRLAGAMLWLAYGAWFAVGYGAYAALVGALRRRGWPVAVAGVAPLVAIEWLKPEVFPVYAGAGLLAEPALIQVADLGGPLLLTALVGLANAVTYETWTWWRGMRPPPVAPWAAAALVGASVLAYGHVRSARLDAALSRATALRVGVVQANLGLLDKRTQSVLTHRRHLEQTRELLDAGAVDLVVWPETAYVRGLRRPLPISGRPILEDLTVPLLFGASSVWEEAGRRFKANSAFIAGSDGMIREAYDKNLLIPLTEYAPFADYVPAIRRWFPNVQEFGASSETPALTLGPWRIATPICYEAIRPDFVRRMVLRARPHLLVTLANDAWFGDSQEPWLHLALARLRAVEHRRFLVRATNSGVSAIVDPTGRIVARTGLLSRENLRGTVWMLDGTTVYTRLGDWPGMLAALVTVLALALRPRATVRPPAG